MRRGRKAREWRDSIRLSSSFLLALARASLPPPSPASHSLSLSLGLSLSPSLSRLHLSSLYSLLFRSESFEPLARERSFEHSERKRMFVRFLETEWSVVSTRRNNYRIFSNRSRQSIYILRTILFEIFFFLNRNFQVDGSTLRNTVYFYSVITIEYDRDITASYPTLFAWRILCTF